MKKYIRAMLDELKTKVPSRRTTTKTAPKTTYLSSPPPPPAPLPEDLNNQELSDDPLQRVRQLDFQAQKDEERQSS